MIDAIVLKTSPYSESTLIVWLLTREEGVARALAKGARRLKGHTAAAFDLYSLVSVKLRAAHGDGLGGVSSVELRGAWPCLRTDLKKLAFASLAMEILGAVAQTSPREAYFFDEAVEFLSKLEGSAAPGSLAAAALLRLLHHAGHPPALAPELWAAPAEARVVYDFHSGLIRLAAPGEGSGATMGLPRALAERLRPWLDAPPPLSDEFRAPAREGPILVRWLCRIWADHLNQPIRSMEFLEKAVFGKE